MTTIDPAVHPPARSHRIEAIAWLVVVAGVALVGVRFAGDPAAMRGPTSLLAAVALGAVVIAPGLAIALAARNGAPALLGAAALALAPLSLLSPATVPLLVITVVLLVAWARQPRNGPLLRVAAAVVALPLGTTCAAAILLLVTTERAGIADGTVHSTDGWVTVPTSTVALAVTALGTAASWWLAPRSTGARSD
jgi:hypothetical protein